MNRLKILVAILIAMTPLHAQDLLRMDSVIELAIRNNLDIDLAQMTEQIAHNQVYRSNAGFGPIIDLNANAGATVNNVTQRYLDGRIVDRLGRSYAPNANVSLNWPIYDGGRMQATFERLQALSQVSSIQTQATILTITAEIVRAYYEVMRLNDQVTFLETTIQFYEDRLKITEERWNIGQGSKIDFLQSKADLNAQIAEQTAVMVAFRNAKVRVNELLNRPLDIDFSVQENMQFRSDYKLSELLTLARNQHPELLLIQKDLVINHLDQQAIEAGRKPQLQLNSTVGFFYTNSNANFLLSNRNASANVGLAARWNIFDGQNMKNQIAITQLGKEQIEQRQALIITQIESDLTTAFNNYQAQKALLQFEQENQQVAQENLEISLEKFRLGGSTILELQEAQRSFDIASNRLVNVQHNIRMSELDLLQISGMLLQLN